MQQLLLTSPELSRLRGVSPSVLSEDIEVLREEVRGSQSTSSAWSMLRVLRDPRLRLPLLLACTMQAGQQTSGINAVSFVIVVMITLCDCLSYRIDYVCVSNHDN